MGAGSISVDMRQRAAGDAEPVDAAAFFDDELPGLLRDRADLAAPGARHLGMRSLAVDVDGRRWTLDFDGTAFSVVAGDRDVAGREAHAVVRLAPQDLTDLVHDVVTPVGLFSGGTLDMPTGRLDHLLDWWVVLRSVLDGRRAHVPGDIDLAGIDLTRSFGPGSDPAEQARFLAEAGFLHLTDVFDPDEMAAISRDMDEAAPGYRPGDGRSWWVTTGDGDERLARMQHFQDESPTTAALLGDERLTRLGDLFADGHRFGKPGGNRNLVEALVKPIGVVEGISDVPWHKDCSLGGHSQRCCSMTVGISITGADAESGQLRVVAGSNRALVQPAFVRRGLDLPEVALPTATGDVTVHLSCTLHMAQPPVSRERRVLYTDLRLPSLQGERHAAGEARLRAIREAAPTTVSQEPSPVAR